MKTTLMAFLACAVVCSAAAKEEIVLSAGFSTNAATRVFRDFPITGGMADADGFEFDFKCSRIAAFSGFTLYLKSGDGWYVTRFSPEHDGEWMHFRINKSKMSTQEGKPNGWRNVSVCRICGWRATPQDATIHLANLRTYREDAKIIVLRTESERAEPGACIWATRVYETLATLGVPARQIADSDLTAATLDGIMAVVLPYNPTLPKPTLEVLKDYVGRGGKLLVCYVLPDGVAKLIGVKRTGYYAPDSADTAIAGFLRAGDGLKGQPPFSPQNSWRSTRTEPEGEGKIVAFWANRHHQPMDVPALISTPNAIYMGHVWNGGVEDAQLDLMRAIVGTLAPKLTAVMEQTRERVIRRREEQKREAARIGLKPGELRAVWCHTPYGYDAAHDWEESVAFMKRMGYTDLVANLCWGGMAFYASDVLPVSPEVATRGDALDLCQKACRRHGVRLHVWKVCWRMNRSVTSDYCEEMKRAGRTQVKRDGTDQLQWFCPSHPENQRVEIETMLELARRGVDGVHFDYIRYNSEDGCFCAGCRARFEAQIGEKVADWPNAVRRDAGLKQKWRDFRCGNITKVVQTVAEKLHGHAKTLVSAAVFQNVHTCPDTVGQDWSLWCRNGWLDFACPMDYTPSAAQFEGLVRIQMEAAGKVKLYPGIGLSCWPCDGEDVRRLGEQMEIVRKLGLGGFTVFSLSTRAETAFPAFRQIW